MRWEGLLFITVQTNDHRLRRPSSAAVNRHDFAAAGRGEHHFRVVLVDEQGLPESNAVAYLDHHPRLQADEILRDQRNPAERFRIFDALLRSPRDGDIEPSSYPNVHSSGRSLAQTFDTGRVNRSEKDARALGR